MFDIAQKVTHHRLLRNAAVIAVVVSAALLEGACAQHPAPPPPEPTMAPPPPPAPAPTPPPPPVTGGERG